MKLRTVTLPELALVAGTRVALGVGVGLLLAGRFRDEQRRAVGWTLFLLGALNTVPVAIEVLGREEIPERSQHGNREAG